MRRATCWVSRMTPIVWRYCRSRGAEVEMLSADFLKTAQLLRQRYPDLEVVVPLVNAKRREQFEKLKRRLRRISPFICWTAWRARR